MAPREPKTSSRHRECPDSSMIKVLPLSTEQTRQSSTMWRRRVPLGARGVAKSNSVALGKASVSAWIERPENESSVCATSLNTIVPRTSSYYTWDVGASTTVSRWIHYQRDLPVVRGYLRNYQRQATRLATTPGMQHLKTTFMREQLRQGRGSAVVISRRHYRTSNHADKAVPSYEAAFWQTGKSLAMTTKNAVTCFAASSWNATQSITATAVCLWLF